MDDLPRSPGYTPATPTPVREPENSGRSQILTGERCLVCRRISKWDEKYRFWFLHENYSFPETLEHLTRSLGFCFFHGAQAALDPSGQSSLTFVHNVLARRVGEMLSRDRSRRLTGKGSIPSLASPDTCRACVDRDDATGRALSSLVPVIEQAESDCRLLVGSLCFPHVQTFISQVSRDLLLRIVPFYETTLSAAVDMVGAERENAEDLQPDQDTSRNDSVLLALHLVAGDDGTSGLFPPFLGQYPQSAIRNPVADFLKDLSADEECPVCKEIRRSWTEWMAWLTDNHSGSDDVCDLLPVCPAHLRATFHLGNRRIAIRSIRNALDLACSQVRLGLKLLVPPPVPDRGKPRFRPGRLFQREEKPFREVRRVIGRPLPCPVCHRLSTARDRALILLFALLESPQHQARFERGNGLCLKHFSRALTLKPHEGVRAILTEVQIARLALLQWELEESMRKDAWTFRPEAAGTERTAWARAIHRFSGSFPECGE
jgi:hypothetical protein